MRFLTLACLLTLTPPALADPSVSVLPLDFAVREFRGPQSRVGTVAGSTDSLRDRKELAGRPLVLVWGERGGAALSLAAGAVVVTPLKGSPADLLALERGRDAIPASRVAVAGALSVTLVEPTRDYPHEALGSPVHARSLAITERRAAPPGPDPKPVPTATTRVAAGDGGVFEDREPRLAHLDGDGVPEILAIRSLAKTGSQLVVIARRDTAWTIVAETPAIGEPNRWLNVAAVADFAGTGRTQIALVRTPHAEGILQLWSFAGGKLALAAEKPGYANHAFGQTAQDLAAAIDLAGNGRFDLVLPSLDRGALALVSFRGGVAERWRVALPARAATGLAVLGAGRDTHILVGLEDGRVADVRP